MLASYIGISRSLLSMTEIAERALSAPALHRANQLLAILYKKEKQAPPQETIQIDSFAGEYRVSQ